MPGDIIILYMCTKNYDHMMYGSWDLVHDGWMDGRTDRGTGGQKKWHIEWVPHLKNQIEMSRTLPEPSCIHFGIDKGPGSLNLHNSRSIAFQAKFLLPSVAADSSPEGGLYLENIVLNRRPELLQWVKDLEICIGVSLLNQPPQVLLQTNASITGWGQCYKKKTAGFGHARKGTGI